MRNLVLAACVASSLLVVGCGKKETAHDAPAQAKIAEVVLGRSVNTAQQVDVPVETFAPSDTIFAAVKTEHTPVGTRISASWVFTEGGANQVVSQDELQTNQAGTGYTSFHIVNPGPWPAGKYEVRIGLDGVVKETKGFAVRG